MHTSFSLLLFFFSFTFTYSQETYTEYVLIDLDGRSKHLSGESAQTFDLEKEKTELASIIILNYHYQKKASNHLQKITAETHEIQLLDESGESYVFLKSENQDAEDSYLFSFSGESRKSPLSMIYPYLADPLPYFSPYFAAWGECPDEYPEFMAFTSFDLLYKDDKGKLLMKRSFHFAEGDWENGEASIRTLDIFLY